jgi:hypothetical protein
VLPHVDADTPPAEEREGDALAPPASPKTVLPLVDSSAGLGGCARPTVLKIVPPDDGGPLIDKLPIISDGDCPPLRTAADLSVQKSDSGVGGYVYTVKTRP